MFSTIIIFTIFWYISTCFLCLNVIAIGHNAFFNPKVLIF